MNLRAILLCGALSAATLPAADTLTGEFQRALFEEEANRNLPAAIAGYEAVIKRLDEQRQLAATAVFRMGESYRKLGKTNEAVAAYERIIKEFADQETLVKLSGQNLSILRPKSNESPATADAELSRLFDRKSQMQADLQQLRNQYTEEHSLVRRMTGELQMLDAQIQQRMLGVARQPTSAELTELRRLEILLETVRSLPENSSEELRTLNEIANDEHLLTSLSMLKHAEQQVADAEARLAKRPDDDESKRAVERSKSHLLDAEDALAQRRGIALRMLEARVEAARRLAGRGDAVTGASGGSQAGGQDASMLALRVEYERLKESLDQLNQTTSREELRALVQVLLPDATLARLDEMAVAARVELAGLLINYGAEHGQVKAARAKLDEINKSIDERISAVIAAAHFKLKSLEQVVAAQSGSPSPLTSSTDPATRARQKELLEQEIALVEDQVRVDDERYKVGTITTDRIRRQRELLALRRRLAALESTSQAVESQKQLIEEELKLVDQMNEAARLMLEAGRGSRDDLVTLERERMQLRRELIDLERGPAVVTNDGTAAATMTTEEAEELRRVQALAANSPDLLNVADRLAKFELDGEPRKRPVERAAARGWAQVIDFLLKRGARADLRDGWQKTPLHIAAEAGHQAVVERLIQQGVRLDAVDNNGRTALFIACEKGFTGVAAVMIRAGADVNLPRTVSSSSRGVPGNPVSPLAVAKAEISRHLLHRGALPDGPPGGEPPIVMAGGDTEKLELLLAHNAKPGVTNSAGETALHYAVKAGNLANVGRLVVLGLDPNARDVTGVPVIEHCVQHAFYSGTQSDVLNIYREVLMVLLETGADVNTKLSSDFGGIRLLHVASRFGDLQAMKYLIEKGAEVNARADADQMAGRPDDGHTPLHVAAAQNQSAAIRLLVEHTAEVNVADHQGDTPLHFAAMAQALEAAQALVDAGADRELENLNGQKPRAFVQRTNVRGHEPSETPMTTLGIPGHPRSLRTLRPQVQQLRAGGGNGRPTQPDQPVDNPLFELLAPKSEP